MKIFYGTAEINIDVTDICLSKLTHNNIVTIPSGDSNRAQYFSDPVPNVLKKIIINNGAISDYNNNCTVKIKLENNSIIYYDDSLIEDNLRNIHSLLKINHGSFNDELPEQKMAIRYLSGNEKVLELGGNIGRNTLIISHILEYSNNLVSLETDREIANKLEENRDLNGFSFFVENSALSKRKLIQKSWETIPSDTLLDGYFEVNTITLDELYEKYNIVFDTLVIDCEGAFYYILLDMPEILNNINLIIMENDYTNISHKEYVDQVLTGKNFYRDYVEEGGWGPCQANFFEVWKR